MKKISAVLLVLVLVGSVAFAGFTGSASTGFGYDLDTSDYGFMGKGTAVSIDLSFLSVVGEAKGEGDIYASIKATLDFSFSNADASDLGGTELWTANADAEPVTPLIATLDFDHAKVFGADWYISILGTLDAPNFATSTIDSTDVANSDNSLGFEVDDSKQFADIRPKDTVLKNANGVEVGYMDYVMSIGFNGNADAGTYNLYGTMATPAYELADGVTAKFGAAGFITAADKAASGSVKVAYAADEYSASVAADIVYDDELMFDAAVAAAYDAYSLDVYFATDANRGGYTGVENLLSAKVVAALDPLTVTVTGKDLINAQKLGASVKFQVNDELAVTGRGAYTLSTEAWEGGADVAYVAADYTAKLGGTYYSSEVVKLSASIESTTIIPGATLKLAYAGDDLTSANATAAADEDNGDKGSVKASIKIAF